MNGSPLGRRSSATDTATSMIRRPSSANFPAAPMRRASTLGMEYPMHVVPFAEFMAMESWAPHQTLKAEGKLREFDESMRGRTFFISHQWTSFNHPDKGNEQLQTLHHVLRRLAAGEMNVKGNFIVEFGYGLKQGHTSEQWKAILPDSYFWVDYMCMPQPLASLPDEQTGPAAHAGQVGADHRLVDGADHEEVSVLIDQLKAAVDSIPAYIENCAEMFVVVPSIKHADRAGCVCDFSTWRSRGWCRMEFVSTRLACHGDIPVMVIDSKEKTPTYFNLCDTMKLFAGNGTFTIDDDKHKVKAVLTEMLAAKSETELAKGNIGLARGHVIFKKAFLDGLNSEEAALSPAEELEEVKKAMFWRDDATERAWTAKTGATLLHAAAALDKVGAAKALLAGADGKAMLNGKIKNLAALDLKSGEVKSSGGMRNMVDAAKAIGTPLQCAMGLGGSPEMIETLIDAGAKDPSFRGFLVACEIGSKATMAAYHDKMVAKHPKAPWLSHNYAARFGATPLHVVAGMSDTAGQREKVEWLLEKSGDAALQKQWWLGGSPLAALAMNPEADVTLFDFFVQKGCDPNEQLKPHGLMKFAVRTMRALKFVAPKKFSEVDEMVDFMGGGGTPLHRASGAMVGSVKNMQKLIENGAKNDGVDRYGQLPIDNLLKFHPDSKAPDILGSGLVPPAEKLRRASKAIMTMNKMNTMTGGKEVLGDEATRAAARV